MKPREALALTLVLLPLVFSLSVGSQEEPSEPSKPSEDVPPITLRQLELRRIAGVQIIHPPIMFLDKNGRSALESGDPLSLMKTCGACHETEYIEAHNYHSQVGFNETFDPREAASGRPWDQSPGMFGRWNPLTYGFLTPEGFPELDMGTADWVREMGPRHVGGGPAVYSIHTGVPLEELTSSDKIDPETHVTDPPSGEPVPWDWKESGAMELNCLLCHMKEPNNTERISEIRGGRFKWASTATLLGSGLVEKSGEGLRWIKNSFDPEGYASPSLLKISDPKSANCRLCHGRACRCTEPVIFENSLNNWATETTGEIFSAERMFGSGMNLKGKDELSLPWDVHAERLLECVNCHYSMNNPEYNEKESVDERPRHLRFDARRLSINNYLLRPDHNFAKGNTSQGTVARRLSGSMRDCGDCHDALSAHEFLPYKELHFMKLACQTCHIPNVYAPARRATDWTVLTPAGGPAVEHRGVEGKVNDPASLITGYEPVLLMQDEREGNSKLGPHNIITSWFWVEGGPERPVRLVDLKAAYFSKRGGYHPDIISALDVDKDGKVTSDELKLDTDKKVEAVKKRLGEAGVENPGIRGEIQPYTLSHGVATGRFALGDCKACHGFKSRITDEIELADHVPGGVMPELVGDSNARMHGELFMGESGALIYKPSIDPDKYYIHGADRLNWLDIIGIISLIGAVLLAAGHGGLRVLTKRSRKKG